MPETGRTLAPPPVARAADTDRKADTDRAADADIALLTLRLGDDALILGQRLCQWITRAPTIEEDLALSNIALDLVGHARALLARSGQLDGTGRSEDDLAFGRTDRAFRNALLTELPNGDFAVTVARQLAYTHYAVLLLEALADGTDQELAAFAARAAKETAFHRRHADLWTVRLGLGTEGEHPPDADGPGAGLAVHGRAVRRGRSDGPARRGGRAPAARRTAHRVAGERRGRPGPRGAHRARAVLAGARRRGGRACTPRRSVR